MDEGPSGGDREGNGACWFASEANAGWDGLPARAQRLSGSGHINAEGQQKTLRRIKILYAEDYDPVLFTVKQLLEQEGWAVDVCRDGSAALKRIEDREQIDVIILDSELPGIRGLELLKRTRQLMHRRYTPVIVFTAGECERDALDAGADAFLKKPGGIRDLTRTIGRLLDGPEPCTEACEHIN